MSIDIQGVIEFDVQYVSVKYIISRFFSNLIYKFISQNKFTLF